MEIQHPRDQLARPFALDDDAGTASLDQPRDDTQADAPQPADDDMVTQGRRQAQLLVGNGALAEEHAGGIEQALRKEYRKEDVGDEQQLGAAVGADDAP